MPFVLLYTYPVLYNTSYKIDLRDEPGIYLGQTLLIYGCFMALPAKKGKNPAKLTDENTARTYGYAFMGNPERRP